MLVLIVSVLVPVPVIDVGLNGPVAPLGKPLMLSDVDPVAPVTVMVEVPLFPATSVRLVGEAESV